MRQRYFRRALCGLVFCIPLTAANAQTIWYVNDDAQGANNGTSWGDAYADLRSALTAAQSGDQIWVAAGLYVGNFTLKLGVEVYGGFAGTESELAQRDWKTNPTILDGNQTGSVVTSPSGATATTRIDGFTITNGTGRIVFSSVRYGGGMYLDTSTPTIANNTITGNRAYIGAGLYLQNSSPIIANNAITDNNATGHGGGLFMVNSSPTISNNMIVGNYAGHGGGLFLGSSAPIIISNAITDNSAGDGGGLRLTDSSPTIMNNTIKRNDAHSGGGGLHLDTSSPTIANNTISGNSASYGGGLYLQSSSPAITHNAITGNSASHGGGLKVYNMSNPTITYNAIVGNSASHGGGLFLVQSASPTIANNTIANNKASIDGGGLSLESSSPTIANNTITGNSARDGGGLVSYFSSPTIANTIVVFNSSGIYESGGTPTLRYNCVYGNAEHDYSGITDPTGTDGNMSADPRLADPRYGNTHVQPDSPCVDAGSNADAIGDFDIDGQPRIQPIGGTVDIGADESDGTVWLAGPSVIVRVNTSGDDANDGSSWASAKRTVQAGIDAASALYGEVWVQAGVYYERIALRTYSHLFGGFAGNERARNERDWRANVTTLDGQRQGTVVTALGTAGAAFSEIDGFTITNGMAQFGGGFYFSSSSLTLANNTIIGNIANYGGGLYLTGSSLTITNNTITGNGASDGGGLYLDSSAPIIANSAITGNSAERGGGLYLYASQPWIENNTITRNSASDGGGLYLNFSGLAIANTIVAFNSSGICQTGTAFNPPPRYNCVYGNSAYNYSGLTDPTGTIGNISVDPRFVRNPDQGSDGLWGTSDDDPGDLHLGSGSPAINGGDSGFVPQPGETDLDGHARVLYLRVDMGAYEFGIGDFNWNQHVDAYDFAVFCFYMQGPVVLQSLSVAIYDRSRPIAPGATGPGALGPPLCFDNTCAVFDFNADGDVDLRDFAGFQRAFTGQ